MSKKIQIYLKKSPVLNEKETWETQLSNFYELKTIYDQQTHDLFQMHQLPPVCIQCNRSVGSIFQRKFNKKKDVAVLFAKCGDTKHPCSFNIRISVGKFTDVFSKIDFLLKEIHRQKNDIILGKNNLLFGYETSDTILDIFDSVKKQLSELNFTLNRFYSHVYNYGSNNHLLTLKSRDLQEKVYKILSEMKEPERTPPEIVRAYLQLEPLLQQFQQLKYAIHYVERDLPNHQFTLIQKQFSISQLLVQEIAPKVSAFHFTPPPH
jgi:hypothetical protein